MMLRGLQRHVNIEYGVPKVSQKVAELMASCKAKDNTRYAIDKVGIAEGEMVVTDGRRLLVITPTDSFDPPIADGLYHLTGEGFLLKTDDDRKFPNWRDIITKDAEKLGDFCFDGTGSGIARIAKAIFEMGIMLNIQLLLGALAGLKSCQCSSVTIGKEKDKSTVVITADSVGVSFQYVQMPIS